MPLFTPKPVGSFDHSTSSTAPECSITIGVDGSIEATGDKPLLTQWFTGGTPTSGAYNLYLDEGIAESSREPYTFGIEKNWTLTNSNGQTITYTEGEAIGLNEDYTITLDRTTTTDGVADGFTQIVINARIEEAADPSNSISFPLLLAVSQDQSLVSTPPDLRLFLPRNVETRFSEIWDVASGGANRPPGGIPLIGTQIRSLTTNRPASDTPNQNVSGLWGVNDFRPNISGIGGVVYSSGANTINVSVNNDGSCSTSTSTSGATAINRSANMHWLTGNPGTTPNSTDVVGYNLRAGSEGNDALVGAGTLGSFSRYGQGESLTTNRTRSFTKTSSGHSRAYLYQSIWRPFSTGTRGQRMDEGYFVFDSLVGTQTAFTGTVTESQSGLGDALAGFQFHTNGSMSYSGTSTVTIVGTQTLASYWFSGAPHSLQAIPSRFGGGNIGVGDFFYVRFTSAGIVGDGTLEDTRGNPLQLNTWIQCNDSPSVYLRIPDGMNGRGDARISIELARKAPEGSEVPAQDTIWTDTIDLTVLRTEPDTVFLQDRTATAAIEGSFGVTDLTTHPDGSISRGDTNIPAGNWFTTITPNIGAQYQIMAHVESGPNPTNAALDTWIDMSSNVVWALTSTVAATTVMTVSIRDVATETLQGEATWTLNITAS